MEPSDRCIAQEPIHAVDVTEADRHIAMAVASPSIGNPMWIIITANKTTGELTCALRRALPEIFIPR